MDTLQTFASENTVTDINYVNVGNGVSVRCINFVPQYPLSTTKILFIPGWISQLGSWRYFLPKVTEKLNLIYMETREKSSSRINSSTTFSINDISNDIVNVINHFDLRENEYVLAGSSLGATSILEAVPKLSKKPLGLVLILPNSDFGLPKYAPMILKLTPVPLLPIVRELIKWAMLKFRVNPDDYEHQQRFMESMDASNILKLRDSTLAVYGYKLDFSVLNQIKIPCLVIGATKDGEHNQEEIRKIANNLPLSVYLDLITFTATHSTKAAQALLSYIIELSSR
ncbi:MAG: alpha/beta hydrolase [Calditrichaeota bacterium]|nr:alpha/beta hydrolase [Calditrichota bacterium]